MDTCNAIFKHPIRKVDILKETLKGKLNNQLMFPNRVRFSTKIEKEKAQEFPGPSNFFNVSH